MRRKLLQNYEVKMAIDQVDNELQINSAESQKMGSTRLGVIQFNFTWRQWLYYPIYRFKKARHYTQLWKKVRR